MWYKSLYEMPLSDKPADSIIEDDLALDRWYTQWQRDVARRSSRSGRGGGDPRYKFLNDQDQIPEFRG